MTREDPKSLVGLAGTLIGRPALVVGNGESRLTLCLGGLPGDVLVFGCNALYRDFTPDYLGSIDVLMTSEIVRAADGASFVFIGPAGRVRQWEEAEAAPAALVVADKPSEWTTGPMMVHAAAVLGCDPIYLAGFDVGWTPRHGYINSVYRDTPMYAASECPPNYHISNWGKHLAAILAEFPSRRFLQIGPKTLPIPAVEWSGIL